MAFNKFYHNVVENIDLRISLHSLVSLKQIDRYNVEVTREYRGKGEHDSIIPIIIPDDSGSFCVLTVKPTKTSDQPVSIFLPTEPFKVCFTSSYEPLSVQYHLLLDEKERNILSFNIEKELNPVFESFASPTPQVYKNVITHVDFLVMPIRTTLDRYRNSFIRAYSSGYKNLWPITTLALEPFWDNDRRIPRFIHPEFNKYEFTL